MAKKAKSGISPQLLYGSIFFIGALLIGYNYRRRITLKKMNWKSRRGVIQFVVGGEFKEIKLDPNRHPVSRNFDDITLFVKEYQDHTDAMIIKNKEVLEHIRIDFKTESVIKLPVK